MYVFQGMQVLCTYALDGELWILGNSALIAIIKLLSAIQAPMAPFH